MTTHRPYLVRLRGAANSGKPDVGGRPYFGQGIVTIQSGAAAHIQKLPLPTASSAAFGTEEGVHPMGTYRHRREADGTHRAGAMCPRQIEGLSI